MQSLVQRRLAASAQLRVSFAAAAASTSTSSSSSQLFQGPFSPALALQQPSGLPGSRLSAYRVLDEAGRPFQGNGGAAASPPPPPPHSPLSDPARVAAAAATKAVGVLENRALLRQLYGVFLRLNALDGILYEAQRQGRLSFYMTALGEEAATVASAAALRATDVLFAQYRETGALLWRGETMADLARQCVGSDVLRGKGRQMPVHYGSRERNFVTISSPLTTQMPQAVGAAYALTLRKQGLQPRGGGGAGASAAQVLGSSDGSGVVGCYFGDGAASEGDFHAAMNFAATLSCPLLFMCRNNGYAISTPTSEQFAGDGIVPRSVGYGMPGLRCDGNDAVAVYVTTEIARELCESLSSPVLVEYMTYRRGHHSTSDDSLRYRTASEISTSPDPVFRLRRYLLGESPSAQDEEADKQLREQARAEALQALKTAESELRPGVLEGLFDDVYAEVEPHLAAQRNELREHIRRNRDKYPLAQYGRQEEWGDGGGGD